MDVINSILENYPYNYGSHDRNHIERVVANCLEIARTEKNTNLKILIYMALLHDICRSEEPLTVKTYCDQIHKSINKASEILDSKTTMSENEKKAVLAGIRTHSFGSIEKPNSLEAKILWDADKLEAIGPIGIARSFLTAGFSQSSIVDVLEDGNKNLENLSFYTKTGKKLAKKKIDYVKDFIEGITFDLIVPDKNLLNTVGEILSGTDKD